MNDSGHWEGNPAEGGLCVHSAGHIFAKAGRTIDRPHGREDYLLFYVAAGRERFFFDEPGGREEDAEAGSLVFFAPYERQCHICISETAEFYYVHLRPEKDGEMAARLPLVTSHLYRYGESGYLAACFQALIDELQLKRPYYREMAVNQFEKMCLLIRRRIESEAEEDRHREKQIYQIIHAINRTYGEPRTLADYAEQFGMSRYYFSRVFKEKTGQSPIAYRNRIRMRHACEMLEESDMTVSAIAEAVGYPSAQYFSQAFREAYGCSPSVYRKAQATALSEREETGHEG